MSITAERRRECASVLSSLAAWARSKPEIRALAVVGSWARGLPAMTSDLDVVVLTDDEGEYAGNDGWVSAATGQYAPVVRTRPWGRVTERRVRLASGFEIEFGFAGPIWAETDPIDPGTAGVVSQGVQVIHDPFGVLARLLAAKSALGDSAGARSKEDPRG